MDRENLIDARSRSRRTGKNDDQICHNYHGKHDLGHIVDQCNQLALGQFPAIDLIAPKPNDGDNGKVDNNVSQWIEQRREFSHTDGSIALFLAGLGKTRFLRFLARKRADHAYALQILTRNQGNFIQKPLYHFKKRDGTTHDQVQSQGNQHHGYEKNP